MTDKMSTPSGATAPIDCDQIVARVQANGGDIASATAGYVRYKPGESTVVGVRFELASRRESTFGYAHHHVDPCRSQALYAKAMSKRPRRSSIGPGVLRVDVHTVLYALPNDARLPRLRWYVEPRKLKRSLSSEAAVAALDLAGAISGSCTTVEVLRYKPLRRVVVRANLRSSRTHCPGEGCPGAGCLREGRDVVIRYATRSGALSMAQVADHLRSAGVSTPKPLVQLERDRVSIDEFVVGVQLLQAAPAGAILAPEFAGSLHRFHGTNALPAMPSRTTTHELARVRQGLNMIAATHPPSHGLAERLMETMTDGLPDATTPVVLHGDLHAKNVLVHQGRATFVDLERVAVGPAAIDLGYFLAHAIAGPIRGRSAGRAESFASEVLESYQQRCGRRVRDLGWHTSVGLIDQALLVVRHREAEWPSKSRRLLELALALSQRRPSWPPRSQRLTDQGRLP